MDEHIYLNKYLKYKNKYLNYKIKLGGAIFTQEVKQFYTEILTKIQNNKSYIVSPF